MDVGGRVPQESEWLDSIARFRESTHIARVDGEGLGFLEDFERLLGERTRVSAGDRNAVAAPFQRAVVELLARRGIAVECPVASVAVPQARNHCADLSFRHADTRWIVEIKTGLEFNSLGAAVLGARLFKQMEPQARFVLVSLYAKSWSMQPGQLLECVRSPELIDDFIVVSVNQGNDYGAWERWHARFADGIRMLTAQLPGEIR
jgi:hypothetical protein